MKPLYDRTKVSGLMDEDQYLITLGTVDVYKDVLRDTYYILVYGDDLFLDYLHGAESPYIKDHVLETVGPELFQQILAYINLSQ